MLKLLNGLDKRTVEFIRLKLQDSNLEIISIADNFTRGIVEFFGLRRSVRDLLLGVDPWTGHIWPSKHYKELFFDPGHSPGDVKFLWEFMKHNFLPALGKAYRLTGDAIYAKSGVEFIKEWLKSVEDERGASWAGHPHICQRITNWLFFFELIEGSEAVGISEKQEIDSYLNKQWRLLEKEYERPANNHRLISICFVIMGRLYNNSASDLEFWLGELKSTTETLFLPDGGFSEQSTSYHRFSLESLLLASQGLKNAGYEIPSWLQDAVERSLVYFDAVLEPSGQPPVFGDNSDEIFIVREWPEKFWDMEYLFAFGRSLGFNVRKPWITPPSLFWIIGLGKVEPGGKPEQPLQAAFPDSGHFVLRDGEGSYVFFRAGSFGLHIPGETWWAHSHSDQLGLVAYLEGIEILTDPGTYRYNENDFERMIMKDESFHSTVMIKGVKQAKYSSSFIYKDALDAKGTLEDRVISGVLETEDFRIQREVQLEDRKLVITDRILARPGSEAEWYFALSPNLSPVELEPGKVVLQEIGSLKKVTLSISEEVSLEVLPGYVSYLYNRALPSQRLHFGLKVDGVKVVKFVFAVS